jgi:hypothetical protein
MWSSFGKSACRRSFESAVPGRSPGDIGGPGRPAPPLSTTFSFRSDTLRPATPDLPPTRNGSSRWPLLWRHCPRRANYNCGVIVSDRREPPVLFRLPRQQAGLRYRIPGEGSSGWNIPSSPGVLQGRRETFVGRGYDNNKRVVRSVQQAPAKWPCNVGLDRTRRRLYTRKPEAHVPRCRRVSEGFVLGQPRRVSVSLRPRWADPGEAGRCVCPCNARSQVTMCSSCPPHQSVLQDADGGKFSVRGDHSYSRWKSTTHGHPFHDVVGCCPKGGPADCCCRLQSRILTGEAVHLARGCVAGQVPGGDESVGRSCDRARASQPVRTASSRLSRAVSWIRGNERRLACAGPPFLVSGF